MAVGDRVLAMPKFGGYSDVLVVSVQQIFKMPPQMTFEQGAAFPVVYVTAHDMMLFNGNLRPGSSVLIHSAAGGVGLAAIQIAKTRDCVILGVASASKHASCASRAASTRSTPPATTRPRSRAIVGDKGVDLILDAVGGRSWTDGYDLLAPCGRLVAFGLSAASLGNKRNLLHAVRQLLSVKKWNPMKLMDDNKTISGTNMGHLFARPDLIAPQLAALIEMYGKRPAGPRTSTAPSRSPRPPPRTSTSTTANPKARCCWCREAQSGAFASILSSSSPPRPRLPRLRKPLSVGAAVLVPALAPGFEDSGAHRQSICLPRQAETAGSRGCWSGPWR